MKTIEEIEAEIEKLPPEDLRKLAEWLAEFHARQWDLQIEVDAKSGGRLRKLVDEAKSDFRHSRTRPLP